MYTSLFWFGWDASLLPRPHPLIRWLPCGYMHVRMSWSRNHSVLRQGLSIQMEAKAWDQPAFLSTYKLPHKYELLKIFYDRYSVLEKRNFATDLQLKVGRNKCSISSLRTSIGQILSPLACNEKGRKGERAWDLHDIEFSSVTVVQQTFFWLGQENLDLLLIWTNRILSQHNIRGGLSLSTVPRHSAFRW